VANRAIMVVVMADRNTAFVVFGLFVSLSAAYVAFQLADAVVDVTLAQIISGIVFGITAILLDRIWRARK
jgi:hypothetical protein